MRQGLLLVRRWLAQRQLVFVADSSYACLDLLDEMRRLPNPITMVVRFRMDAALFAPAPERKPGTNSRPRKWEPRMPKLTEVVVNPKTVWQRQVVANWYGSASGRLNWRVTLRCGRLADSRWCRSGG